MGASLNTDDNMLIEFAAPRRLYEETSSRNYRVLLNEARPALQALETLADFQSFAAAYARRSEYVRALIVLKEADQRFPGSDAVLTQYNSYQAEFLEQQANEEQRQEREEQERQERYERQREEAGKLEPAP